MREPGVDTPLRLKSPQELCALEGYTTGVDPGKTPLRRVIGTYVFPEMFHCGLRCNQPNKYGLVVELEDGRVTNVGHVCGEGFGEKFLVEEKKFTDNILRPRMIAQLGDLKARLATMAVELHGLRIAAGELAERLRALSLAFPMLYRDLVRREQDGDDKVSESFRRSDEELEALEESLGRSRAEIREQYQFRQELRGHIPGLLIFGVKVREVVVTNLVAKGEALVAAELPSLSTEKLIALANWADGFEAALGNARRLLGAGEAFFKRETFALLAYIARSRDDAERLRELKVADLAMPKGAPAVAVKETAEGAAPPTKRERAAQKKLDAILRASRRR